MALRTSTTTVSPLGSTGGGAAPVLDPPGLGVSLQVWMDAGQAGAGDVPEDKGRQANGLMTKVGSPVLTAGAGPAGATPAWVHAAASDYYTGTISSIAIDWCAWCIMRNDETTTTARYPFGTSGGLNLQCLQSGTGYRHSASPSLWLNASRTAGAWELALLTRESGNDSIQMRNITDGLETDSDTNVSDAASGTGFRIGTQWGTSLFRGRIAEVGLNSAIITMADLLAYAQSKYPGAF